VTRPAGDTVADGAYRAFPDEVTDRLIEVVLAAVAEIWTVRDRVRLLEAVLAGQGIDATALLEARARDPHELAAMRADREAFIERVLRTLVPPRRS
jgi:hypothetical protein